MSEVFWTAGPKIFYNKLEALEQSVDCKFNYRNKIINAFNFTKNTNIDISHLIKNRLVKMREHAKKLILWYSGGTDSKTILENAYKNNILFDEIIFYDKKYESYPHYHIEKKLVLQDMNTYKKKFKNTITVLDVGYDMARNFYTIHGDEWIRQPFITPRFSKNMRYNILNFYPKQRDRLLNDNNIHITGNDHPRLFMDNNKWFLVWFDTQEYDSYYLKFFNFYWDDLEILNWQIHKSIDFFESHQNLTNDDVQKFQSNNFVFSFKEFKKSIGRIIPNDEFIANGIMKKGLDESDSTYECASMVQYAKNHDNKVYKIYQAGMDILKKNNYKEAKLSELIYIKAVKSMTYPG